MDVVFEDETFQLMNLPASRTGVAGVVSVFSTKGEDGPRVKWYPGRPGQDVRSLSVSIEDKPEIINHGMPPRQARIVGEAVAAWVVINHAALISFWNEGLGWTRAEVNSFIDGLAKLS